MVVVGHDPDQADVRLVAEMVSWRWPDAVAQFRPALDRGTFGAVASWPVIAMTGRRTGSCPSATPSVTVLGAGHVLPLEAVAEVVPRTAAQVGEAFRR